MLDGCSLTFLGFRGNRPTCYEGIAAAETAQDLPGSAASVDRLTEIVFVQAMRNLIQSSLLSESPSWLRRLMHLEPGPAWTVPSVASLVSMSRSAFAVRFRAQVGETPRAPHTVADGARLMRERLYHAKRGGRRIA